MPTLNINISAKNNPIVTIHTGNEHLLLVIDAKLGYISEGISIIMLIDSLPSLLKYIEAIAVDVCSESAFS